MDTYGGKIRDELRAAEEVVVRLAARGISCHNFERVGDGPYVEFNHALHSAYAISGAFDLVTAALYGDTGISVPAARAMCYRGGDLSLEWEVEIGQTKVRVCGLFTAMDGPF